jgi:hypothetical protein
VLLAIVRTVDSRPGRADHAGAADRRGHERRAPPLLMPARGWRSATRLARERTLTEACDAGIQRCGIRDRLMPSGDRHRGAVRLAANRRRDDPRAQVMRRMNALLDDLTWRCGCSSTGAQRAIDGRRSESDTADDVEHRRADRSFASKLRSPRVIQPVLAQPAHTKLGGVGMRAVPGTRSWLRSEAFAAVAQAQPHHRGR